ncbi:hypothetical protein FACS1894200_10840 [Spirochaetia bacterium]|nr:hypothetical protein FACS1894200_10840 [Spirochaetia bacterium]
MSPSFVHVHQLVDKLIDNIAFVLEYPYVDRHYRDNYYSYHAAKFSKIARNCIRVHIFEKPLENTDDLLSLNVSADEKYFGYFIVRPLVKYTLGRSLISPKAFKLSNFVCCLICDRVSVLGNELLVSGFPHVAQDTETHSCAESSLWSMMEYYGAKYTQYKPLLPSQIYRNLLNVSDHRLLPSIGLTHHELAKCLQENGYHCLTYRVPKASSEDSPLYLMLKIYIESGIPLLLIIKNDVVGHALLAIGHENTEPYAVFSTKTWQDVSSFQKKLVLIDNNMSPYQLATTMSPTGHYPDQALRDLSIEAFIVPLPVHVFLSAEKAYSLLESVCNNSAVGLKTVAEKWTTRLFLTRSHSFKDFIFKDKSMDVNLRKYLLLLSLPKYIWACEFYREDDLQQKTSSGLLIIDPTGDNKTLEPVLLYLLENRRMIHDGYKWTEIKSIKPLKMKTYQHNLKGVWNKWDSK